MRLRSCGFSLTAIAAMSLAFTACSDSNPSTPSANTPTAGSESSSSSNSASASSSSVATAGSSNDVAVSSSNEALSSSQIPQSSSSEQISASSSSSAQTTPIDQNPDSDPNPNLPKTSPFETWHGGEDWTPINTGYDVGTETSGYWFKYGDDGIGGGSTIIWPIQLDNDWSRSWSDPVIDHCNGICGTAHFNKGDMTEEDPFVGLIFYIAGETNLNDYTLATADASAMGGVCVTYTSQIDIELKLGIGDIEEKYDYNIPTKTLPKSQKPMTKYVPWTDFKQPIDGNGKKISSEEAAKNLASIKFEMHGEHGTNAEFNIKSVGPYNGGDCHP